MENLQKLDGKLVIENESSTRLDLYPLTGRSHQLRVHLKEIGHPIIGDPIYGMKKERMLLHAENII